MALLSRLILLLALAAMPAAMASDHPAQKCDGKSATGTTGGTSCASGTSQLQASGLAYLGFPSVPKCGKCPHPSEPCISDLIYGTDDYTETCFVAPVSGVWICCATMPADTKWDMVCACQ